ncbi:hypothetical protein Ahia01_001018900 [Argonauta hians]
MYYKDSLGIFYRSNSFKIPLEAKRKHLTNSNDRKNECYNIFITEFKQVLGWMYIQSYFTKNRNESIKKVAAITNIMINALKDQLKDNKWLGEKSKVKSLEKLQNLVRVIGFNPKTMDSVNVDAFFKGMKITPNNFFHNLIQIKARRSKLSFSELQEKPNRKGSLNFGGLGTILGHELIHAFDNDGILFNSRGEYSPWLTPHAKRSFEKLCNELIKQYSQYKLPGTNFYVNGQLTLDENIADNGGIHVAYKAFQKWQSMQSIHYTLPGLNLSPDQLFFLTFAQNWCAHFSPTALRNQLRNDPHAPDIVRVILTLQNSNEFSSAYHCPPGSYMNPLEKVHIW